MHTPLRSVEPTASTVGAKKGCDDCGLRLMAHTHLIRAELELATHSCDYFEKEWDVLKTGHSLISCPVTTFINGFGLYCNLYRSLMGFYMTPAMKVEDRFRPANNFPVLLGPHGSDFNDITTALECLIPLDKGMKPIING